MKNPQDASESPLSEFHVLVDGVRDVAAYWAVIIDVASVDRSRSAVLPHQQEIIRLIADPSNASRTIREIVLTAVDAAPAERKRGRGFELWQDDPYPQFLRAVHDGNGDDCRSRLTLGTCRGKRLMGVDHDFFEEMHATDPEVDFLNFTSLCFSQINHFNRLARGAFSVDPTRDCVDAIRNHPRFDLGLYAKSISKRLLDLQNYCDNLERDEQRQLSLDDIRGLVRKRETTPYRIDGRVFVATTYGVMGQLVRDVIQLIAQPCGPAFQPTVKPGPLPPVQADQTSSGTDPADDAAFEELALIDPAAWRVFILNKQPSDLPTAQRFLMWFLRGERRNLELARECKIDVAEARSWLRELGDIEFIFKKLPGDREAAKLFLDRYFGGDRDAESLARTCKIDLGVAHRWLKEVRSIFGRDERC